MKILLLQAYSGRREKVVFPLGLAHIASYLSEYEFRFLDPNLADEPYESIKSELRYYQPDVVALSLRNVDTTHSYDPFWYYESFARQARLIKRESPRTVLVVGGSGFSIFAEQIMRRLPEIDYGVVFDGEETFPELLSNLENPSGVKGVIMRSEGKPRSTGSRQPPEPEKIRHPRWDIADIHAYRGQGFQIGVQTKRGCPFNCLYCVYPLLGMGHNIRARAPEVVGEELEQLATLGVEEVHICDPVFNFPPEHAEAICREMIRRGLRLRWRAFFTEKYTDESLLKLAHEAGCVVFEYSPDGYTLRTLRALRKPIDTKDLERVYSHFKYVSTARLKASFILNPPGDSFWNLARLLLFLLRMSVKLRYPFFSTISLMRIYPNTGIHRIALEQGVLNESDDLLKPVFYNPFPLNLASYIHDGLCWLILKALNIARREWKIPS